MPEEIENEMKAIAETGLQEILILNRRKSKECPMWNILERLARLPVSILR